MPALGSCCKCYQIDNFRRKIPWNLRKSHYFDNIRVRKNEKKLLQVAANLYK
jgi:hypothetical protein